MKSAFHTPSAASSKRRTLKNANASNTSIKERSKAQFVSHQHPNAMFYNTLRPFIATLMPWTPPLSSSKYAIRRRFVDETRSLLPKNDPQFCLSFYSFLPGFAGWRTNKSPRSWGGDDVTKWDTIAAPGGGRWQAG